MNEEHDTLEARAIQLVKGVVQTAITSTNASSSATALVLSLLPCPRPHRLLIAISLGEVKVCLLELRDGMSPGEH